MVHDARQRRAGRSNEAKLLSATHSDQTPRYVTLFTHLPRTRPQILFSYPTVFFQKLWEHPFIHLIYETEKLI